MRIVFLMISLVVIGVCFLAVPKSITQQRIITGIVALVVFSLCVVLETRAHRRKQRQILELKSGLKKLSHNFDQYLKITTGV